MQIAMKTEKLKTKGMEEMSLDLQSLYSVMAVFLVSLNTASLSLPFIYRCFENMYFSTIFTTLKVS